MKWEYKTLMWGFVTKKSTAAMDDALREAGEQGWELVSALPTGSSGAIGVLFFKRPLS